MTMPACREYFHPEPHEQGQVPEAAFKEKQRTKLCLADIALHCITPAINQFEFLEICHINKNHLCTLPQEFFDLVHLQSLDASENRFTHLSSLISRLTNLVHLNLSHNCILNLPNDIGELFNLKTLNLNANRLKELPVTIQKMTNLRELHLGNNLLLAIPSEIQYVRQLKILNLKDNVLMSLPSEIGNNVALEVLNLSNNFFLEELPFEIGHLRCMRKLAIRSTDIRVFPYTMLQWSRRTVVRWDEQKLGRTQESARPGTRVHTLVEIAAARVFPRFRGLNPYALPFGLFDYLIEEGNRFRCPSCIRSGRREENHYGRPSVIVRRMSKRFSNRSRLLPFVFHYCFPCFSVRAPQVLEEE